MKMSNTYYLCGFMGAGKSSILNKFQQQSNYSTIDLDSYIENKYGGIDKIFEEKGESYFRTIEEKEFFNHQNKFNIMAIGGGAVENNDIFQYLIDCKQAIYLNLNFDELWERIKNSKRPLVNFGKKEVKNRFINRKEKYEMLQHRIPSENIEDAFNKILKIVENEND